MRYNKLLKIVTLVCAIIVLTGTQVSLRAADHIVVEDEIYRHTDEISYYAVDRNFTVEQFEVFSLGRNLCTIKLIYIDGGKQLIDVEYTKENGDIQNITFNPTLTFMQWYNVNKDTDKKLFIEEYDTDNDNIVDSIRFEPENGDTASKKLTAWNAIAIIIMACAIVLMVVPYRHFR